MKKLTITTVILLSCIIAKAQADSVKVTYNADGSFGLTKYYNHGKTKFYKLSDRDQMNYNFTNEQAIILIDLADDLVIEEKNKKIHK